MILKKPAGWSGIEGDLDVGVGGGDETAATIILARASGISFAKKNTVMQIGRGILLGKKTLNWRTLARMKASSVIFFVTWEHRNRCGWPGWFQTTLLTQRKTHVFGLRTARLAAPRVVYSVVCGVSVFEVDSQMIRPTSRWGTWFFYIAPGEVQVQSAQGHKQNVRIPMRLLEQSGSICVLALMDTGAEICLVLSFWGETVFLGCFEIISAHCYVIDC